MIVLDTNIQDAIPIQLSDVINKSKDKSLIFLSESNKDLFHLVHNFPFFCNTNFIVYPEWDCDFFDSIPPSRYILNLRIRALSDLSYNTGRVIVLTTPRAVARLTIPKLLLQELEMTLYTGYKIEIENAAKMLIDMGYLRVSNAVNYGEYAVRGDILDIANIDNDFGYRINFFGNNIETIKKIDLITQSSTSEACDRIKILPVEELILSDYTIANFKKHYNPNNPTHQSIADQIKTMNYVHYMPWFYDNKMSHFLDFIPKNHEICATNTSCAINANIDNEADIAYAKSLSNKMNNFEYPKPSLIFKPV